jgi:hypothetical protein
MTNIARLGRSVLFVFLAVQLTGTAVGQGQTGSPFAVDRATQSVSPSRTNTSLPVVSRSVERSGPGTSLAPAKSDVVRVVSSTARGVVLEFSPDSFSTSNMDGGLAVSATGFERLAEPGEPDLPSRVVFVGIPQTGNVRLSVATEGMEMSTGVTVRPAVGFGGERRGTGDGRLETEAGSGFWPAAPAEILSIEALRGVRVARVRVSPAQYDAATRSLRLHHKVRVSLTFDRPAVQNDRPDALDSVIAPMLVNGSDAIHWKLDLPLQDSINFFERSNVWCRIKTETTGVYRVTAADLRAAGFDPESIAPATMKLYSIGPHTINGPYPDTMVQVPVYVKDNGDAKFDKGEYLAFYAESPSYWQVDDSLRVTDDTAWRTNAFTNRNCWWLTWGGENGRRMDTVSGAGATNPLPDAYEHVRLEPDSLCPARSGLLWLWRDIVKIEGLGATDVVQLKLPQRDTLRWIKGRFYGRTDATTGTHYAHARIYLNGSLVDSLLVRETASVPPAVDFDFDNLPAGAVAHAGKSDSLTIELYGDEAMDVFLDYLEVGYTEKLTVTKAEPQLEFLAAEGNGAEFGIEGAGGDVLLLDVTNPYSPVRIAQTNVSANRRDLRLSAAGFRRLRCALSSGLLAPEEVVRRSPGNLRNAGVSGDYFVVCPDEFYHVAELFARYREGNVGGIPNAHVQVAELSEVYDDYAFGSEEPGAIKHLLQAKRPAYVLLAGDGTYDYRNILQLRTSPVLPPYEVGFDIDPEVYGGAAKAIDAWYADLDGGGTPDLILGRVTVRSPVEFRQFLDRVKKYETQPLGYWAKRYVLLADDEIEGSYDREDPIKDHIPNCEEQARIAAGLLDPVKVYLTEYPLTGTNLKAQASADFIRQLNSGAVLFCFFGHGAGFQLCHEQVLHITNTVPNVNNGTRSPIAFYGSCGVGRFEDTRYEAIAEELVRKEGGTIAGVGATKATGSVSNAELARIMFGRLINYPDDPIGPAFYQAYTQANTLYHLFGDPATVLRMPHHGPVPVVRPDTLYPGGRNEFEADDTVSAKGSYEVSAHEAIWHRDYHSTYTNGGSFTASYELPGYEIHHAAGSFDSSQIRGSFIVPRIQYPETTDVANGRYIRLPNTGRVSLLSLDGSPALSYERDSMALDTQMVVTTDDEPPVVGLYADGIPLVPGDTTMVPGSFNLVGRLSDSSGIFLVPNMDPSIQDVVLSLRKSGTITPLTDYFHYCNNSTVAGQFAYPLALGDNFTDSLTVVAADNMVDPTNPGPHRTRVTVMLATQRDTAAVKLTDCLVYPNPTSGPARFTFLLTRAATVSVKIFTIAGRLVRVLPAVACGFDYNQIEWDGRDKDGQPLANGVYLYKLDAQAIGATAADRRSASFRDKFIVHR